MSPFFLLPNTYGLRVKMIVIMVLLMVKATLDWTYLLLRIFRRSTVLPLLVDVMYATSGDVPAAPSF